MNIVFSKNKKFKNISCPFQYIYLMSKLTGKDAQPIRGNSPSLPIKPKTAERTVLPAMNICDVEDSSDCGQDELTEQIASSRSRVSLKHVRPIPRQLYTTLLAKLYNFIWKILLPYLGSFSGQCFLCGYDNSSKYKEH